MFIQTTILPGMKVVRVQRMGQPLAPYERVEVRTVVSKGRMKVPVSNPERAAAAHEAKASSLIFEEADATGKYEGLMQDFVPAVGEAHRLTDMVHQLQRRRGDIEE